MKKTRVSLTDLYMGIICLFPVMTILGDEGVVNKILFVLLFSLHIGMLFSHPIKKRTFYSLFVLVISYIYVLYSTKFPLVNINMLVYFPFFLLYTYFMCDHGERVISWFFKNELFVHTTIVVWSIVVGVSIFLPGCYYSKAGGIYFGSFCESIFRLGPSAVFIQTLIILSQVLYNKRNSIFYMVIPMYCYLMGSSRTYLVIGFLAFIISWYITCRKRAIFWLTVIPLSLVVLLLIGGSALGEKIAYTLDNTRYGDFWFRITSSRNIIWESDLAAWQETPLLNKFFGNGLNFTFEVMGLWAHNDFIEILCSFGILGLLQYIRSIYYLYKNSYANTKIPFSIKVCALMVWLFNAFFNMHYVYFCAMLCYPFLLLGIKRYFMQTDVNFKWE